jgi:hypothetical protein
MITQMDGQETERMAMQSKLDRALTRIHELETQNEGKEERLAAIEEALKKQK